MRKAIICGILGLAALTAFAQNEPRTLRKSANVGDTVAYRFDLKVTTPGKTLAYAGKLTQTVLRIEADNSLVIESAAEGAVGGNAAPKSVSTAVLLPNGVVKELLGDDVTVDDYRVSFMGMFQAPPAPVGPSDFWVFESRPNPVTGARAVRVVYNVEAAESFSGYDTFRIKVSMSETSGANPATADGTIHVDVKTGWIVKSQMIWRNAPAGPNGETIDATVSLTREG
ncbi:MAG: hypothetical protein KIS66_12970 [Fimbriimonadaceae bacterium]|nr:hypothetical protein [Fimbriimonadaceae bacterium]